MAAFLGSSLGAGNDFLHPLHAAKLLPAEHSSPQGRGQPPGPGQPALPGDQLRFVITEKAMTPRSLNVKLGPRRNYHEGQAAIRHYANQPARPL